MNPSTIAIVGMAGRFPGARNLSGFWQNLRDGVESIRDRSDAELRAAGATGEELASPDYVKRASVLDDVPMFDASFFGLSPRDASIMDPQHRHFLECAWEALEDSGYSPQRFDGSIGVFAGSGMNTYLIYNLLANRRLLESAGLFQLKQTGNDKDVLATRVSYQFDLRGPSINVQTACSTSLVAVHLACQSLLNFECDMALAGGVTIEFPHGLGYNYRAPSTQLPAARSLAAVSALWCCAALKMRSMTTTPSAPSSSARPSTTMARARWVTSRPASKDRPK
jgi:acyl transferase domain-containing protein